MVLFIMMCKVVLMFESLNEILSCGQKVLRRTFLWRYLFSYRNFVDLLKCQQSTKFQILSSLVE